jgi:benzoyl-CoA reductase/2-hydroxyglutaryl-CoA dehydratase subunit BcrC/BadD/HgdB
MEYCESHIEMVKNIAEIKVKLDQLNDKIAQAIEPMRLHIEQGEKWRIAVIGIIFAGILQIVTFAYFWGELHSQVTVNTERWNRVISQGGFK